MLTPTNVLKSIVQMLVTLGLCTLVSSHNNKHTNFENIFDLILRVQRPLCLVFGNTSIFSDLLKGCFRSNQISGTVNLSPKQHLKTFFALKTLTLKLHFPVLKTLKILRWQWDLFCFELFSCNSTPNFIYCEFSKLDNTAGNIAALVKKSFWGWYSKGLVNHIEKLWYWWSYGVCVVSKPVIEIKS